jgi:hypothetical protein
MKSQMRHSRVYYSILDPAGLICVRRCRAMCVHVRQSFVQHGLITVSRPNCRVGYSQQQLVEHTAHNFVNTILSTKVIIIASHHSITGYRPPYVSTNTLHCLLTHREITTAGYLTQRHKTSRKSHRFSAFHKIPSTRTQPIVVVP